MSSFPFKAVWTAVEIGLSSSAVLSTLPNPTTDLSKVCQVLSPRQYWVVVPAAMVFSLFTKPGTVGASAVPPKSPANFNFPFTTSVASGVEAFIIKLSTAATLGYIVVEPLFDVILFDKLAVVWAPETSVTGIKLVAVIGSAPFPLTYPVKAEAPVPPLGTVITSPIFAFVIAPFAIFSDVTALSAILAVTIPKSFTLKGLAVVPAPSMVVISATAANELLLIHATFPDASVTKTVLFAPGAIFIGVTAPLTIFAEVIALFEIIGAVAVVPAPPKSPANWIIPVLIVVASSTCAFAAKYAKGTYVNGWLLIST